MSPRNATARPQPSQTTADYSASHSEGTAGQNLIISDDGSCVENVEEARQDVSEPMNNKLYEENQALHADRAKLSQARALSLKPTWIMHSWIRMQENEVLIAARDQLTKDLIALQSQFKSHENRPKLADLEPHITCKICLDRLRAPYV
ncbi:hypothetical protein AAF712_012396 [Marasmius tenuissimus]|uniref:Uncharacterized protein n=1 Tax=Marasmius tenuissimus TaxID=585030 RepID=A0ABR2ZHH2_9AGAR